MVTNNTINKFTLDIFILHLLSKNWLLIFAYSKLKLFYLHFIIQQLKIGKIYSK